ncbi:glycosyltransferase [Nocardioides scoriae]|uniref:glycosyltransferase n=1 Tax=Nocardioides scoriae TaxID=642780 RepID=UPI000B818F37|nr:glycosyltransferase family 2 protein [Nocardioides scoriae]
MSTTSDEQEAAAVVELSEIEVVLVTYRSRALVETLLARLPRDLPLVVVDNSGGADAVADVLEGREHARYLDGGGVGFARAANLGAWSSERPYLVFVNPDTAPTPEQLFALVEELKGDPGLAAVSATTVTHDGRVELGVGGWEPTVGRVLVYATGLHSRFPTAGVFARPEPHQEIDLEWLTGACLAVPRETFVALGGFDEQHFIYNEDMAYGRRLREAGLRQKLRTDLLVPHAGAGSGGAKTTMLQMRGASMFDYVRRHNSAPAAHTMRLVLAAGSLGRAAVCRARGNPDAAAGFAAYNRGLWRGAPDMS